MPDVFDALDSINGFYVASPRSNSYAYVEMQYGNLIYTGLTINFIIAYKRTGNKATIECCDLSLENSNLPLPLTKVKFSLEYYF